MHPAASFLAGLVFGLGLILSGMAHPAKVLGFLELQEHGARRWPWRWPVPSWRVFAFAVALKRTVSYLRLDVKLPTVRQVSCCTAREPKAMRYVHDPACGIAIEAAGDGAAIGRVQLDWIADRSGGVISSAIPKSSRRNAVPTHRRRPLCREPCHRDALAAHRWCRAARVCRRCS